MHADAGFRIGSQHTVCQDYAATANSDGRVVAALSDGCSTAPHTDVGARLLVHSALYQHRTSSPHIAKIIKEAHRRCLPGVDENCLKATLAIIWETNAESVRAELYGDGLIFGVHRDGRIEVLEALYSGNMPAYPAYPFLGMSAPEVGEMVKSATGAPWNLTLKSATVGHPEECSVFTVERFLAASARQEFGAADGWRVVGVLSDGASSFYRIAKTATSKITEPVPFIEIAPKLLTFGTLDGPFVVSRLKHFSQWCEKNGIYHADDLSMAAIAFPEAP